MIGAGVGIAIALGVIRIIKNIDVKFVYLIIFSLIFLLCTQVPSEYIALAFDAGGATTGIITAPFLLAVSSGISNKVSKNDNKEVFGMVGIASLGPIISTLLVFIFIDKGSASTGGVAVEQISIYLDVLKHLVGHIGDVIETINDAKTAFEEQKYAQFGRYLGAVVALVLNLQ